MSLVTHRLLLWDVDGTLVQAGPLGAEVFDQAVTDVAGAHCLLVATGRLALAGLDTLGADAALADPDAVVKLLCADL